MTPDRLYAEGGLEQPETIIPAEPHEWLQNEIRELYGVIHHLQDLRDRISGNEQSDVSETCPATSLPLRSALRECPGEIARIRAECMNLIDGITEELFG